MQSSIPTESPTRSPLVEPLPSETLVRMHELMLTSRLLEERMIKMQKQGDGYFWIGGPGEEAFNTALGSLVHKGEGLDYDYLHLHYRSSATLVAMGADPVDSLRQMKSVATDPYSGGRNFCNHYAVRKWNVVPVSSPIEVQYSMAPGTALAQKRHGGKGITIVQGGDAGSAEGDFATCLVWATRPGWELPVLVIVTNNEWGISTAACTQHGEKNVADRGRAFGMRTKTIDGNDIETAYRELQSAMDYVRSERKPMLLEARVSRLYGHSSSSGANYVKEEIDCIDVVEEKLIGRGLRTRAELDALRAKITEELQRAARLVAKEPPPKGEDVWKFLWAEHDVVGERSVSRGDRVPHDNFAAPPPSIRGGDGAPRTTDGHARGSN